MSPRSPARLIGLILATTLVAVLLVLTGIGLYLTYGAKPRVEALASEALALKVRIDGSVRVGLLPALHLTAGDVHFRAAHTELASATEVQIALALVPALHHQAHIGELIIHGLHVTLSRGRDDKLDVRNAEHPPGPTPDLQIATASATDAVLTYRDERTKGGFTFEGCQVELRDLQLLADHPGRDWLRYISFDARDTCKHFKLMDLKPTDVDFTVKAGAGLMDFKPVALRWLGGKGTGTVHADFTHDIPCYDTEYHLTDFRAEEFFRLLTPKRVGEGVLNIHTQLTMRGESVADLRSSLSGEAALHGENLTLYMGDLDEKFAHFESAQNFTLVDSAAFFFAGPIGLGISKGYDYQRILQNNEGSTVIRKLVSEWQLSQGIAEATDVAMATSKNRLALKGGANLATAQIEDVRVALVDSEGCTEALQKVHGPFDKPELQAPDVVKLLATPTKRLVRKAARLLGKKCVAFYTGSVEPPQ